MNGERDALDGIAESYQDRDECLKLVCLALDKSFVFISSMLALVYRVRLIGEVLKGPPTSETRPRRCPHPPSEL